MARQLKTGDELTVFVGLGLLGTELIRVEASDESEARYRISGVLAGWRDEDLTMWIENGCELRKDVVTIL